MTRAASRAGGRSCSCSSVDVGQIAAEQRREYLPDPFLMVIMMLEAFPLRAAITLLLAMVSWPVSAQTMQDERLQQVIANLKACVRTHAPAAQAMGFQTTGDAVNFFIGRCAPLPLVLGENTAPEENMTLENVGAVPPGIFRKAVSEEWSHYTEEMRAR